MLGYFAVRPLIGPRRLLGLDVLRLGLEKTVMATAGNRHGNEIIGLNSQDSGLMGHAGLEASRVGTVVRRPTVTIMLITYNHEKYIAQALDSILMQETEYQYEINVVEDCSTDRTQEIVMQYVRRYPDKVKPFFNAVNIGYKVTQRNTYRGLKTVTGDYFAILEGDDYWTDPHRLQKQVAFLEANPDFAICAGNTIKMYEGATGEPHRFLYWGKQDDATIEDIINLSPFFHNAGVLFRNVYRGNPPRHFRNKRSCDIFITIAHAQFGKVHHMDEDFAVYRAHPGGRFSNRPKIDEWMFDINGLRHFNAWLKYRYTKAFSRSIVKYCKHVLSKQGRRESGPLRLSHLLVILLIRICYGLIHATLDLPQRLYALGRRFGFVVFSFVYCALNVAGSAMSLARRVGLIGFGAAYGVLDQRSGLAGWRPTLFLQRTKVTDLPSLPEEAGWEFVWGISAKQVEAPAIVSGQPILQLTAIKSRDANANNRHALCAEFRGFAPGGTRRVGLWVKAPRDVNVHVQLRDSNVGDTGKPTQECDVWFDLTSRTTKTSKGDLAGSGVESRDDDDWLKLWIDFKTSDGAIYIYLGLVKKYKNTHVFRGSGERILFGGIDISAAPIRPMSAGRTRTPFAGSAPVFADNLPDAAPRSLLFARKTKLRELPDLPDLAEWHFIWSLNVEALEPPGLIPGQPILDLTSLPKKDRHSLCLCLSGFEAERTYRVALWVKPAAANTSVQMQLRDSNIGDTGKPAHECDVWYSLAAQSVRMAYGDLSARGIELEPQGWFKVWTDFTTRDGRIYVSLGLVKANMNSNVFIGGGERLLFGGIAVDPPPGSAEVVPQVRAPVVRQASVPIQRPLLFARKTELFELPDLPEHAEWHFISGLAARTLGDTQVLADQPVLELIAIPLKERHGLSQRLAGLAPESTYRITAWVKTAGNINVQLQLHDHPIGNAEKTTNSCDLWFDVSAQSVKLSSGDLLARGVESAADGWSKIWADFATSDGSVSVYLGLIKQGERTNVFIGAGERVLFGGIVVDMLPSLVQNRSREISLSPGD